MNCNEIKKEIDIKGAELSPEAMRHIKSCKSCFKILQTERKIEDLFLRYKDISAPESLKTAVLNSITDKRKKTGALPVLSLVFKFSAVLIMIFFGFWLGLQTANGTMQDEISAHEEYALNTSVSTQDSMSDIYLSVLEEAANEK